uniref:Putative glutathione s-transferase n=1 Tax=Amblyomma aureolatum TaxID=187763 RepID=A0A1E1XAX7_9ACAR
MGAFALETGSKLPPLVPGKLRLYSMRFCPYALRTLLVLKAKGVEHEVVNVHLRNRPEWYNEVLPAGTVPVLYQDNKVISGSMPIAEYLEEAYPQPHLLPTDPYLKALDRSFLDVALPCASLIGSISVQRGSKEEHWANFLKKIEVFDKELAKRKTPFFGGEQPGLVDYVVWPAFPLARAFSTVYPELKMPAADEFPHFSRWLQAMREHPVVKAVINEDHVLLYAKSGLDGGDRDYNAGLQ